MQPESPYQPPATFESAASPAAHPNAALTIKEILFSFHGRIPRSTFWLWTLLSLFGLISTFTLLMPLFFGQESLLKWVANIVVGFFTLLFIWITIAIRVKRWHDLDRSGLWVLFGLIPYIGEIISFIKLGCTRGTIGPNQYGDDPT